MMTKKNPTPEEFHREISKTIAELQPISLDLDELGSGDSTVEELCHEALLRLEQVEALLQQACVETGMAEGFGHYLLVKDSPTGHYLAVHATHVSARHQVIRFGLEKAEAVQTADALDRRAGWAPRSTEALTPAGVTG